MDSGNSGSMQSSSGGGGGDEEFDSMANQLLQPSFLSHHQHHQHHQNNLPMFNPSSNYLPSNSNQYLNLAGVTTSADRRLELNSTGNPLAESSSNPTHQARNSKKRTRASRRAPTTVLTTDTSNFRAMVQEFTGIPAPPFSGSAYSRRLDLFSTAGSSMRSGNLEMGNLYPVRPAAQKFTETTPFLPTSSIKVINNGENLFLNNSVINASNSSNLDLFKQPHQNILAMQNQFQPFQSLLQLPFPPLMVSGFSSNSKSNFDEMGINQSANLSGLPSHVMNSESGVRSNDENHDHLRSFNNGGNFHLDKGLENVSSRGDGVDSWICPSD